MESIFMTDKDIDIQLGGSPNLKYEKFFEKFKEIDTLDVSSWNATHVLAYFCKKYKETYNVDYKFKFNSPSPSKCFEVFQVKKLSMNLTSKPNLLKEYIDWIYFNKVPQTKKRFTSISFLTKEDIVTEYKFNFLFADKKPVNVDRSSQLPDDYKTILLQAGFAANTYGDLSFIYQMNPIPDNLLEAMNQLESLGFNKEILGKII